MLLTDKLKWRSAIKNFDTTKKLSSDQLNSLLTAIQLAPTSLGLQSFKVVVVEDIETRKKLREAGYNQAQITDASQLLVFASKTNIDKKFGEEYIDLIAKTRSIKREDLAGFEQMVMGSIKGQTDEQKVQWSHKQVYIALGFLLTMAAELGIDATPMEGFDVTKFNEILDLPAKGLTASVIATVGFRSESDVYSKLPKVRKPKEELFIHV
jgi:nitroreductase/dihydropteridine reductase